MNKYDFTKGILEQLGQPVKPKEYPRGQEVNPAQKDPWKDLVTTTKSDGSGELNLLAVFTGTNVGLEKALEELGKARQYGINYDLSLIHI